MNHKISVGTVKFGVPDYGFSSQTQQEFDPFNFLQRCFELGVKYLDTSPRYGDAESVIGQYLRKNPKSFSIDTKVDNLIPNDKGSPKKIRDSVLRSIDKLSVESINICYLHQNELSIISDPNIQEGLSIVQQEGLISQVGVSIYSDAEFEYAVNSNFYVAIQLPVSVFDLGFYEKFVVNSNLEKTFIVRSILLQGILVNRSGVDNRIKYSKEIHEYLNELDRIATSINLSTLEMCMRFTLNLANIGRFIVGTTSEKNLEDLVMYSKQTLDNETFLKLYNMGVQSKVWTNPRNW